MDSQNRRNAPHGQETGASGESEALWPADHVERRPIASLVPYAHNARTHSDAQVAQIAASIREWGWTFPVLVGEDGGIIAGHDRVLAARSLGITEVPVMVARGWTKDQCRAYVLADNQLPLNAGWNPEILSLELHGLDDAGFDLTLLGFPDLGALMADKTAGLTDPDDAPEAPADPVTVLGDVWLLGRHRIVCGDCTDPLVVDKALNGVKPNLMVTDPPYGVEYDPKWRADAGLNKSTGKLSVVLNDDRADWREAWALFPGNVAYVWHASLFSGVVADSLIACGLVLRAQIVWIKDRFALSKGDYHWQHEPCWYAVRKGSVGNYRGGRRQSTRWDIPAREDGGFGHGTQKPVECMKRPIENNSSAGQAVYEPFSGSGTTIIAGEMTGRSIHAIELSSAYVDVAVMRWQAFKGEKATLESDGRTFDEIKAAKQGRTPKARADAAD